MNRIVPIISTMSRVVAAVIMMQTLYFKFTASPESVYIFTTIGMEPWGRIGIGIGELIASVLLFIPAFYWLGALIGIGLMSGAVFFHLTILGIEVMGDKGYLFFLALTVMSLCSLVLFIEKDKAIAFVTNLLSRSKSAKRTEV